MLLSQLDLLKRKAENSSDYLNHVLYKVELERVREQKKYLYLQKYDLKCNQNFDS